MDYVDNEAETSISQSEQIHHQQMQLQIHAALEQLPLIQQTVVSLYHLEEMTLTEISEICDLPQGTIKSHLFRARKRLKQMLQAKRECL